MTVKTICYIQLDRSDFPLISRVLDTASCVDLVHNAVTGHSCLLLEIKSIRVINNT